MKKLSYLLVAAAAFAACSTPNKGYTITGTVEGAVEGDTVYLQDVKGRQLVAIDTAVIANGKFTFEGVQDTAVNRYITCKTEAVQRRMMLDFFLENGNINVALTKEGANNSATGTPCNDAYQAVRTTVNELTTKLYAVYESMNDSTLTEEQRAAKSEEMEKIQESIGEANVEGIKKNITNAAGIHLLKQNYYAMELEDLKPLMSQIPAAFENDEQIIKIKENVTNMEATAVGKKFTDFAMQTPDGKPVKLSDFVGKGKVVLVDFWASWCGPCRREMPNLVEVYKKYKNKNFEIVGVSLDRDADAWKDGIKKLGITWPQMSDLKYWNCEGSKLYAVSGIPHTVLIDGEGTIIARGLHGEELQEKVAEALK